MVEARNHEIQRLQENVTKITEPEVAKAIAVGVRSIGNSNLAMVYRREFVVSVENAHAMEDQEQIGWDHFMMSRMAMKWSEIGPTEAYRDRTHLWVRKVAHHALETGLALW